MARSRFQSNEGKCCDAILHILEREFAQPRGARRFPERDGDSAPVELVCRIGNIDVAIEHTKLEAYPDQLRDGIRFVDALEPIEQEVSGRLPPQSFFMLVVPAGSFDGLARREIESIRVLTRDWVLATAPTMNPTLQFEVRRLEHPDVPFAVDLQRVSNLPLLAGQLKISRFAPPDLEALRAERVRRALVAKLPKLAAWKRRRALTVLLLENDDIALSNASLISAAVRDANPDPALLPDRIYEIDTPVPTWIVWTLRCAPDLGIRRGAHEYKDIDSSRLRDILA